MNQSRRNLLALAVLLATAATVYAQKNCPGGVCVRPGGGSGAASAVGSADYAWHQHPEDTDSWCLFRGTRQIGAYRTSARTYWPITGDAFSGPAQPPIDPPAKAGVGDRAGDRAGVGEVKPPEIAAGETIAHEHAADGRDLYFGVDADKISPRKTYSVNGRHVSEGDAYESLRDPWESSGADIPDDADRLAVTVIGTKAEQDQVRQAIASTPDLLALRPQVVEQYYSPDDPMVSPEYGFPRGNPAILVQDTNGAVLCRADSFTGAADLLAMVGEVRRRKPNYDPAKDPKPGKGGDGPNILMLAGILAAAVIAAGRQP